MHLARDTGEGAWGEGARPGVQQPGDEVPDGEEHQSGAGCSGKAATVTRNEEDGIGDPHFEGGVVHF